MALGALDRYIDRQMDEVLPLFREWGVAGVKIDFMDRDDQWMVNWYRRVARKAAEHRRILDFHGQTSLRACAEAIPTSGRVKAFTRMLAGPLDYTPDGFENVTPATFDPRMRFPMVMTTRAHQLALFVVFESAFQMLADDPGAYEKQKDLEFLRAVPAAWDGTRVIDGRPPQFVTIARRRGAEWYVGGITDGNARQMDVPLEFLGTGSYQAAIYADAPDAGTQPKNSIREERPVDGTTVLKLRVVPGGGFAIRLTPAG